MHALEIWLCCYTAGDDACKAAQHSKRQAAAVRCFGLTLPWVGGIPRSQMALILNSFSNNHYARMFYASLEIFEACSAVLSAAHLVIWSTT
jgi:hypothetical protein